METPLEILTVDLSFPGDYSVYDGHGTRGSFSCRTTLVLTWLTFRYGRGRVSPPLTPSPSSSLHSRGYREIFLLSFSRLKRFPFTLGSHPFVERVHPCDLLTTSICPLTQDGGQSDGRLRDKKEEPHQCR